MAVKCQVFCFLDLSRSMIVHDKCSAYTLKGAILHQKEKNRQKSLAHCKEVFNFVAS